MSDLVWVAGRAFVSYDKWECYQNGFYKTSKCDCCPEHVRETKSLLCNSDAFWSAMQRISKEWPLTTAVHLSNAGINRRAWLGQTSCFFMFGSCRICTVTAWAQMTNEQRNFANRTATYMIDEWTRQHSAAEHCQTRNAQLVFPFLMQHVNEYTRRSELAAVCA